MTDAHIGRPTDCTPEEYDLYLEGVRAGVPLVTAAERAGLDYRTVQDWRARGEAGEEPYAAFTVLEKRLRAEWRYDMHCRAMVGTAGVWTRDVTLLERLDQAHYGQRQELTVVGDADRPVAVAVDLGMVPEDVLAAAIARRHARVAHEDGTGDEGDADAEDSR